MKIRHIVVYVALAAAFLAVSLWVVLSGGKNAKAVRAKFRIGGLMLTISGMLTLPGCGFFRPTCYEPAQPDDVEFVSTAGEDVKVGDTVEFKVKDLSYKSYSYEIMDSEGNSLQKGGLELSQESGKVVIGETAYRGSITLVIYGDGEKEDIHNRIGRKFFTLK